MSAKNGLFATEFSRMLGDKTNVSENLRSKLLIFGDVRTVTTSVRIDGLNNTLLFRHFFCGIMYQMSGNILHINLSLR